MLLRCSGRDGMSHSVSLSEAVTAVRVRVECGLLTEAFLHQRMLCTKVREKKYGPSDDSKGDNRDWKYWTEVLVTEICFLCIRRSMVDRMIELPWNSDEEKHLHKCLLDYAADDLSSTVGSLLVVFYIQVVVSSPFCYINFIYDALSWVLLYCLHLWSVCNRGSSLKVNFIKQWCLPDLLFVCF